MREYRVKITVRNNLLLTAIEEAGYKTQADFARAAGLLPTEVNELVAMRKAPIGERGSFIDTAVKIMEVLGACPTDLWTAEQLNMNLKRNTTERSYGKEDLKLFMDKEDAVLLDFDINKNIDETETHNVVEDIIDSLTPREAKILRLRYGIDVDKEYKFEEIASMFGVTRERIRQIEAKALRKMRHPARSDALRNLIYEGSILTSEDKKKMKERLEKLQKEQDEADEDEQY